MSAESVSVHCCKCSFIDYSEDCLGINDLFEVRDNQFLLSKTSERPLKASKFTQFLLLTLIRNAHIPC